RQRFILAVTVQRLRAAEHSRERLQCHTDDVVVALLRGQRTARGLRMEAQLLCTRVRRAEPFGHSPRPKAPCRAKLRNLLEEIVVRVEKARDSLSEGSAVEART